MKEICISIHVPGYFRRFVPVQPIGEIPSGFPFKIDASVLLGFVILIDIIQPVSETETGILYEPTDPVSFLYQPERGPKREHENNGTSVSASRVG